MTITVLGHLCKDIVHLPGGSNGQSERESFGGIFYSVVTLANLLSTQDTVRPVFGVGNEEYDELIGSLSRYSNVDTKGIFKFKGPTNQVRLFYEPNQRTRIECSKHISSPIPFSRIKSSLDTDALLINMISGSDIALETLDQIRMETRDHRVPIHFDFHSLTLGIDREFKRFRRPLTDWRRWCFMLHSIQISEEEAAGLTAERYDETALVNQLMPLMVSALVITRGERGITLILQDVHKKLTQHEIPGISAGPVADTTGCGDVFGAAFLTRYSLTKDHLHAAEFANRAAAMKSTFTGTEKLSFLHEISQKAVAEQ